LQIEVRATRDKIDVSGVLAGHSPTGSEKEVQFRSEIPCRAFTNLTTLSEIITIRSHQPIPNPYSVNNGRQDICASWPLRGTLDDDIEVSLRPDGAIMAEHTSSDNVGSILFFAEAPHFIIGVQFEPMDEEWEFDSVDASGNWASPGPSVSSATGQTIDFTSTCPATSSRHHLEVSAYGGMWTVYLIKVWTPK